MKYAYLIHRTDPGTESDRRTMSRGTRTVGDGQSPRALAEELLRENRAGHSYYSGPLRCWVWPYEDGQPVPDAAPDGAERYDAASRGA